MIKNTEENGTDKSQLASLTPAALAKGEALVESLRDRYLEIATRSLHEFTACWHRFRAESADMNPEQQKRRDALYRLAHDFKGMGGTYGYPLISTIGGSLCCLLHFGVEMDAHHYAAVDRHVAALHKVISARLVGDGGACGSLLLKGLDG